MPIVTVQCVHDSESGSYPKETVQLLCDELGRLFGSEPGTTWVKMQYLANSHYAENAVELNGRTRPTFVEVLKRSLDEEEVLVKEAIDIAAMVGRILGRPGENVHVIYRPEGAGRVAFGGNLVRRQSDEEDA